MRKDFFLCLFAFILSGAFVPALAQRQTVGRPAVDVSVLFGGTTKSPFGVTGGTFNWMNHFNFGQTALGLDVSSEPCTYHLVRDAEYDGSGHLVNPAVDETYEFTTWDIAPGAGFYLRLLAPRSRVVILSAGLNLNVGIRFGQQITAFVNPNKSDGSHFKSVGFLINLTPELKFEVFPLKNASLYVSCRPKIQLVSGYAGSCDWLRLYAGFGIKYYI